MKIHLSFFAIFIFFCFQLQLISQTCVWGDCKNGYCLIKYADSSQYIGSMKDGLKNGIGKITFTNGDECIGQFDKGSIEGLGTYTWKAGGTLRVTFVNSKFNGIGVEIPTKDTIVSRVAYWQNGKLVNVISKKSGCLSGECENGWGEFLFNDGSFYKGNFKNGKPEGEGVLILKNNAIAAGTFNAGLRNGSCVSLLTRIYTGMYKNGLKCGEGTYYWANGDYYSGSFDNDKRDGKGTQFTKLTGGQQSGLWKNDVYIGNSPTAGNDKLNNEAKPINTTINNHKTEPEAKTFTNKTVAPNKIVNGKKEGEWIEYRDNDLDAPTVSKEKALYYSLIVYKEGIPTGQVNCFDVKTNKLVADFYFSNGKKNGSARTYRDDGKVESEDVYKDGKLNGISKTYYETGELASETPYVNDKASGISIEYYRTGKKLAETPYAGHQKQGTAKEYYESGVLKNQTEYYADKKEGYERNYYEEGKLESEAYYQNDKIVGEEKHFDLLRDRKKIIDALKKAIGKPTSCVDHEFPLDNSFADVYVGTDILFSADDDPFSSLYGASDGKIEKRYYHVAIFNDQGKYIFNYKKMSANVDNFTSATIVNENLPVIDPDICGQKMSVRLLKIKSKVAFPVTTYDFSPKGFATPPGKQAFVNLVNSAITKGETGPKSQTNEFDFYIRIDFNFTNEDLKDLNYLLSLE